MSVFSNIYLSKYNELEDQRKGDQLSTSFRVLLTYCQTVTSSFLWKNVTNVPFFMPEKFLLYSARLGVFEHEGEIVIYPIYPAGALMPDGEYSAYTAIMPNGTSVRLDREDVAIIFNNSAKLPSYPIIADFAKKSSFALGAVDVALKRAMIPPLVGVASPEQLKKIIELDDPEQLMRTVAAMIQEDGYGAKDMQRLPYFDNRETDVLSLWDVFSRYDRLFYRTFGVSTVGIQKNERLTKAESTGEEEMTRYSLFDDMWQCRKFGIEEANKKFGTNFEIEIQRDEKTVFEEKIDNEEKIEIKEAVADPQEAQAAGEEKAEMKGENENDSDENDANDGN